MKALYADAALHSSSPIYHRAVSDAPSCPVNGEVVNYAVELQDPLPIPFSCNSPQCVLRYDATFIEPDVVEPYGEFECDGPAHLFIDTVGCDNPNPQWCRPPYKPKSRLP